MVGKSCLCFSWMRLFSCVNGHLRDTDQNKDLSNILSNYSTNISQNSCLSSDHCLNAAFQKKSMCFSKETTNCNGHNVPINFVES